MANLSRVDPAVVSTGNHGKKHFHTLLNDQPLVFTSVIVVDQCYLNEGKTNSAGKSQKLLRGSLLEGEFERFVGAVGMVAQVSDFRAQYYKDVLDFSTFMEFGDGGTLLLLSPYCACVILTCPAGTSASPFKKSGGRSTCGQPSPFTFRPGPSAGAGKMCLSFKDIGEIFPFDFDFCVC